MVEAQHVASTMKLVDDAAEQDLLEVLLEEGKPPLPAAAAGLDYLLATPFRYPPLPTGSRFRAPTDPGVFYGAQHVRTACAELAYWRWRFLMDAVDLERLEPVAHTAFRVRIATMAVDLRTPPFDADAAVWTDPLDYRATQAFAAAVREADVGAIVYRSVRDPELAWCVALLSPAGFASPRPEPQRQTWWIAVQRDSVVCRRENEALIFSVATWRGPSHR
ncbi:RES domain-containing protein [Pseudothauera rhizosphaerae]|uniref:RES domain-containing protein n=1 Tax=Pseudothauera rhizosphaerae TaxID=2565932 RepID=A0A4S4AS83_9RHOO|nr:RES domain-containing protein [Pseudothauera rhizosphaerae]